MRHNILLMPKYMESDCCLPSQSQSRIFSLLSYFSVLNSTHVNYALAKHGSMSRAARHRLSVSDSVHFHCRRRRRHWSGVVRCMTAINLRVAMQTFCLARNRKPGPLLAKPMRLENAYIYHICILYTDKYECAAYDIPRTPIYSRITYSREKGCRGHVFHPRRL